MIFPAFKKLTSVFVKSDIGVDNTPFVWARARVSVCVKKTSTATLKARWRPLTTIGRTAHVTVAWSQNQWQLNTQEHFKILNL